MSRTITSLTPLVLKALAIEQYIVNRFILTEITILAECWFHNIYTSGLSYRCDDVSYDKTYHSYFRSVQAVVEFRSLTDYWRYRMKEPPEVIRCPEYPSLLYWRWRPSRLCKMLQLFTCSISSRTYTDILRCFFLLASIKRAPNNDFCTP